MNFLVFPLEPETWNLEPGTWNLEPGTWNLKLFKNFQFYP